MAQAPVVSVENLPKAVVVHVQIPNLGKGDVDAVCNAIDQARLAAPTLPFILDMAKVGFVPSVGLGVLVGLHQEFRNRKQRLIFVSLQNNVRDAINVTYLNRMLEIMSDVPTALGSVGAK
jgi:anti-anti-sigma factor